MARKLTRQWRKHETHHKGIDFVAYVRARAMSSGTETLITDSSQSNLPPWLVNVAPKHSIDGKWLL